MRIVNHFNLIFYIVEHLTSLFIKHCGKIKSGCSHCGIFTFFFPHCRKFSHESVLRIQEFHCTAFLPQNKIVSKIDMSEYFNAVQNTNHQQNLSQSGKIIRRAICWTWTRLAKIVKTVTTNEITNQFLEQELATTAPPVSVDDQTGLIYF